jgi:protein CpxP
MSRRALAAPLAFALLAVPALAQQQGAPSDLHERDVPGTAGVAAVPGIGSVTDSGSGRGSVNDPNRSHSGPPGAESPTSTGPLEGGGGPNGPSSAVAKPRADAGSEGAGIVLAQNDITAQSQGSEATPPATAPGSRAPGSPDMRVQQQLHDLYTRLRITPAEEPQWDGFAHTLESNAQHMRELWASRPAGTLSALDDMRNYAQMAQAHATDMQRLVAAFAPLYTSLSPEQKAAADQAFQQAATRNGRRRPMPQ